MTPKKRRTGENRQRASKNMMGIREIKADIAAVRTQLKEGVRTAVRSATGQSIIVGYCFSD